MGQIETLLGLDYIDSYLQRINAVTIEDIADVCDKVSERKQSDRRPTVERRVGNRRGGGGA